MFVLYVLILQWNVYVGVILMVCSFWDSFGNWAPSFDSKSIENIKTTEVITRIVECTQFENSKIRFLHEGTWTNKLLISYIVSLFFKNFEFECFQDKIQHDVCLIAFQCF